MEIIKKISPLLQQPVTTTTLLALQPLRLELATALADKGQELAERKRQVLWPKDKEMTELDRKLRLNGDVAEIERDFTLLRLVNDIISDLVSLTETIRLQ